jgi:hypothetical protein
LASWIEKNENKLSSRLSVKRWIYDEGKNLKINPNKHLFLYVTSWKIKVNWKDVLWEKFQLRANDENEINLEFLEKSDFLVIESE